jgi:hypothetical protein
MKIRELDVRNANSGLVVTLWRLGPQPTFPRWERLLANIYVLSKEARNTFKML